MIGLKPSGPGALSEPNLFTALWYRFSFIQLWFVGGRGFVCDGVVDGVVGVLFGKCSDIRT